MLTMDNNTLEFGFPIESPRVSMPKVTCVCPTFGRLGEDFDHTIVIAEAVESFLRQTYERKELVVVNDTPGQTIVCDAPGVRVINLAARCSSIGAKRNLAIQSAVGSEIIFVWDDDDISLPRRIEHGVRSLLHSDKSYLGERDVWVSTHNSKYIHDKHGNYGLTASSYYFRDAALKVPYQDKSFGEDHSLYADFEAAGLKAGGISRVVPDISYIYRWGYLVYHVSGFPAGNGYELIGEKKYPKTTIRIEPRWAKDYVAECQAAN